MSRRVLVVDDEQCIADSLAAILRGSDYDALALYDAETAWAACSSQAPDLVITDVIMPGMSGIDLAIRIKERYPQCKVLLFSGMAATADLLEEARSQGHDFEILAKPVHPSDLLAKMAA
ncbi:MAG: response regulator [Candidatus Korobacteraceae bacterium]